MKNISNSKWVMRYGVACIENYTRTDIKTLINHVTDDGLLYAISGDGDEFYLPVEWLIEEYPQDRDELIKRIGFIPKKTCSLVSRRSKERREESQFF